MMPVVTVTRGHTTLDLLLYRQLGPEGQGYLSQALEANPGLAALGAILPIGTKVRIPENLPVVAVAPRPSIDLFG